VVNRGTYTAAQVLAAWPALGAGEEAAWQVATTLNTGGAHPEWYDTINASIDAAWINPEIEAMGEFDDDPPAVRPDPKGDDMESPDPFDYGVKTPIQDFMDRVRQDPDLMLPIGAIGGVPALFTAAGALVAAGRTSVVLGTAAWWPTLARWFTGAELLDLVTPGIDLPSPSDIPQVVLEVARKSGSTFIDVVNAVRTIGAGGPPMPQMGPGSFGTVVLKSWTTSSPDTPRSEQVWFYRMSDGWTWVYSPKKREWKRFRQPKPTVLYAGGAGNLKTLLKAVGITSRQLKRIDKAVNSRLGPRKRTRTRTVTDRSGTLPRVVQISND